MRQIFIVLLTIVCSSAFAQYGDYFRRYDIYGGVTYVSARNYIYGKTSQYSSSTQAYDTLGGNKGTYIGPAVGFGLNLPFVKPTPDMSVGMHVAANLALVDGLAFNVPLGLQYRYGSDATLDCEKNFGFSIGGGYNFYFVSGDIGEGIFKYPYLSPEISYNTGIGLLKIKSYIQFTEQYYHHNTGTQTLHTYMKAPLTLYLAICPNFND